MTKSNQGNRSKASAADYLLAIAQGQTLDEIGAVYGVTDGAVRKMLKTYGLPTCAMEYLKFSSSKGYCMRPGSDLQRIESLVNMFSDYPPNSA